MKNIGIIFLSFFLFSSAFAQSFDKKIQASYLFGFGRMLQWNNYSDEQIVINVYGSTTVTDYVNNLSVTNKVGGRKVVAREIVNNIGICNMLYIPKNQINNLNSIIPQLQGKSILVISDARGYLNVGVDVEFGYKHINSTDSIVSYKYNPTTIKQKDIKIGPYFTGYSIIE